MMMDSHNPPSKIARLSGSPPIGLGLELGRGSGDMLGCTKSCGFTFLQLQELEHQALIYKYMEAGLPVPYHLVYPIWKSVACSLGGLTAGAYQHHPGFLGLSPLYLDYKNSMDPEPGRCRRTDGKKWRCSKEAVPDQKYCERHMHRGRQRSRKHVEASQLGARTATSALNNTVRDAVTSNTNLSISLPVSSTTNDISPKSVLQLGAQKTEPS
ncbi:growth-regulating factor 10-like [Vitis riparia]|uniref:growth-regulating factor 10-like n=1 Tax=Vitis riparia TaxID=96939 RepID=UPI00155B2769|nr:growth-regulating factor 10-like [Vitis riparia]